MANFQYLMTCLSFSISKPFRKELWTNTPFFISVIVLTIFNTVTLFMSADAPFFKVFNNLNYKNQTTGQTYYQYRYFILVFVVINSLITFFAEKLIIEKVTKVYDAKKNAKRYSQFDELMATYQPTLMQDEKALQDELETEENPNKFKGYT